MNTKKIDRSADVLAALRRQCPQALAEIGAAAVKHAQREIQRAHRVETGDLMRSIRFEVRSDGVYVGTNLKYAAFHELGTGRYTTPHQGEHYGVKPLHYLHHAASRHTAEYKRILRKNLKGR